MISRMTDCLISYPDPARPGEAIGLTYLAEGAAHVVYRVSPRGASTTTHPDLVGRLFRFRKSIPSAVPCADSVSFHQRLAPLFPEDSLVDLSLHDLPDQKELVTRLNAALRQREANGTRSAKRHGIYLTPANEEPHHILVTDMSPHGPHERLIEFKPKWLVQSPSAPTAARRCRTCALREMRMEDQRLTGQDLRGRGHADFCPLDLLSPDDDVLNAIIKSLSATNESAHRSASMFKKRVQPLFLRLRDLQAAYNNVSLDEFLNGSDQDFSVAMTLRDCSVFIKSSRAGGDFDQVRLADLDLKSNAGGKVEKWAHTERRLITEGWYTGTENADSRGQRFCRAL